MVVLTLSQTSQVLITHMIFIGPCFILVIKSLLYNPGNQAVNNPSHQTHQRHNDQLAQKEDQAHGCDMDAYHLLEPDEKGHQSKYQEQQARAYA